MGVDWVRAHVVWTLVSTFGDVLRVSWLSALECVTIWSVPYICVRETRMASSLLSVRNVYKMFVNNKRCIYSLHSAMSILNLLHIFVSLCTTRFFKQLVIKW